MLTKRGDVTAVILLSAVLLSACGDRTPSAPSPTPTRAPSPDSPPAPSPVPQFSHLVGVWNLTVRLTDVSGKGPVADTMRSQIGEPKPYSLSITQTGDHRVAVTLKTAWGHRACTFTPTVDSGGFTTYGQGGYYTCDPWSMGFRCSDGTQHSIYTFGEDISGRVSGAEISGAWDASWFDGWDDYAAIQTKAQFTGTRQ